MYIHAPKDPRVSYSSPRSTSSSSRMAIRCRCLSDTRMHTRGSVSFYRMWEHVEANESDSLGFVMIG